MCSAGDDVDDAKSSEDERLDEALIETFPASDPPANTVETGIGAGSRPPAPPVVDNAQERRFELTAEGETAYLLYERRHGQLRLIHTEVPPPLRGQHYGDQLVQAALAAARVDGSQIVAICPFVKAYLRKHPRP